MSATLSETFATLAAQAIKGRGDDFKPDVIVVVMIGRSREEGADPIRTIDLLTALPEGTRPTFGLVVRTLLDGQAAMIDQSEKALQQAAATVAQARAAMEAQQIKIAPATAADLARLKMAPNGRRPS